MKFLDVQRREGCQDMSSKEKDALLASPAVTVRLSTQLALRICEVTHPSSGCVTLPPMP